MTTGTGLTVNVEALLGGLVLGLLTGRIVAEVVERIPAWMEWQFAEQPGPCPLLQPLGQCRHAVLTPGLTALLMSVVLWRFGWSLAGGAVVMLTVWLITLALIDRDTHLLPDCLTLSGLWMGLLLAVTMPLQDPATAILGAALGYLLLRIPATIYEWLTGQSGMGHGDFKLLAMIGAWLGPSPLLPIITLACTGGALWSGWHVLRGHRAAAAPLAFGPWLASAAWVTLMWNPSLLSTAS